MEDGSSEEKWGVLTRRRINVSWPVKTDVLLLLVLSRLFMRPFMLGAELGVDRNPIKPESLKEEAWPGVSYYMCKTELGVFVQCLLITLQT